MNDLFIQKIPLGIYQANAYLVGLFGRDDAFVVDPGDDYDALLRALEGSHRRLTDILITHGHFDHILSAAPLARRFGAHVHIHPMDMHMLLSPSAALYSDPWCRLPFEPMTADAPYPQGTSFQLDACSIALTGFLTPGHTPGSVCLLDQSHKILFTGDTLFADGWGRTDFAGGSEEDMRASLRFLFGMDRALTVYPGHGEVDTLGAIIRRFGC